MTTSWPWLPPELYLDILLRLPVSRDTDSSVLALVSCIHAGNKGLKLAAVNPSLWEAHYRARYTHSSLIVEPVRQAAMHEDWYKMYSLRRKLDIKAVLLLDKIVGFEGGILGRHRSAAELVKCYS
jgi:F-box protein 21